MSPRRRRLLLAWALLHFFFILVVCCRSSFWIFSGVETIFPRWLEVYFNKGEQVTATALGQRLDPSNPLRHMAVAYLHGAGIESGYGFFAPSVPDSYKLVFELTYADGQTKYELPPVAGSAAGLRVNNLLTTVGEVRYESLRQFMIKMVAYSVWLENQDSVKVRAVFGYITEPTPTEFKEGKRESYTVLTAYDFVFSNRPARASP